MSDLREYLEECIAELEKLVLGKHNELRALQQEMAEARRALAAVDRRPTPEGRRRGRYSSPYPESIKVMIREVLAEATCPISADRIQSEIATKFKVDVVRTTLSPQISRLAASGEVLLEDGFYTLTRGKSE